jgi:HD-GYP domain-containing protein (c-di-GMP phosphodiesterase class II)
MSAPLRLAELLGALSIACDVTNGFPPGKAMRTALLAEGLARLAGASEAARHAAYHASILRYLGCTGFAHEEGHELGAGDDLAVRSVMCMADAADPIGTLTAIARRVGGGAPVLERARAVWRLVATDAPNRHARAQGDTAKSLARVMGLGTLDVILEQVCERWDGRGEPHRLRGDALDVVTRVHVAADVLEIAHHRGGLARAVEVARVRSGKHLDPHLAALFVEHARALLEGLDAPALLERFVAAEPEPRVELDEPGIDRVVRAFGFYADLKSVYTLGHSSGVATLAVTIADALGVSAADRTLLTRAGHLHDVGRLAISNRVWDRKGPLDFSAMESVRLHAYYTERVLSSSPALAPLAAIAAGAHERIDATGYPRAASAPQLPLLSRILAVADVAHAMREERPHRPPQPLSAITEALSAPGFDRRVARAALDALGAPLPRRARGPKGLSERELEIVRLVARGKTNQDIGALLGISARTVQAHLARTFDKLGVSSRAGAAVFAMEHGLVAVGDDG